MPRNQRAQHHLKHTATFSSRQTRGTMWIMAPFASGPLRRADNLVSPASRPAMHRNCSCRSVSDETLICMASARMASTPFSLKNDAAPNRCNRKGRCVPCPVTPEEVRRRHICRGTPFAQLFRNMVQQLAVTTVNGGTIRTDEPKQHSSTSPGCAADNGT